MREGSAFFKAEVKHLKSFNIGMSFEVPLCRIRLNRIHWLIFTLESIFIFGFLYSIWSVSTSPDSSSSCFFYLDE